MSTSTRPTVDDVIVFEPPPRRRPFSPGDVVRLLVGLVLVLAGWLLTELGRETISGIERDLVSAVARLPDDLEDLILGAARLVTSLVPLAVLLYLLATRRWRRSALLVLAGVAASGAIEIVDDLVLEPRLADLETSADETDRAFTGRAWPGSDVIASTTAVVTVAAPWLSRRWKRALWSSIGLLVLLRLVAVALPALDVLMAIGVGTVVGSLILVLFGSPTNEPGPGELLSALRSAGVDPARIDRSEPREDALRYQVVERDGTELVVRLRTPDEYDADLLNRFYRGLRYRGSEVRSPYATLQRRIEHEALVLGLARGAGVRAAEVIRIGTTERGSAFFVASKLPARPATPEDLGEPGLLLDVWDQVGRLHRAGLAHRHLAVESIGVDDDGHVWMRDFDHSETAATERERARDIAQLLTETAAVVGAPRAVAEAVSVLGPAAVAPSLRMLQPLALPPATRARAAGVADLLEDVRAAVTAATGEPELELEELERFKPRTLLIIAVSALAFYSLLPQLVNLDETIDAFGDAEPWWMVAAVGASALTYVFATVSLQGAVADALPYGPTLRAQVAASFAGLVGPANLGRYALTERFLERLGVPRAEAGASVAVNAIAGLVVHLALMVGFFVWAGSSNIGGFSLPDSGTLLLVVAVALAVVGVLLSVRPVRRKVFVPFWSGVRDGTAAIGRVFTNPTRVAELFGGSAGITLSYLAVTVFSVEAFGGGLGVAEIGAAYLGAIAIATFAPTPGGLGALESAMIAGLTAFGLPAGVAVSATLTFRLSTFWLPVLPGWVAFGWMQRNDEL
ncbi:MAG: lysylphosphatidylglycerol synthase transmembrane domain-containing protein [Ilumatobacter sp.]|uniref:lysylphosphatidylglycerol synthase transmembrane domain-containing protein n=1 Tax=Ilumatobacter sp. TaxID=1967498 RepID=UPI002633602A|nr:lysylphosphatidylglycerol synthase transmembrane domain-containing protein [Ilumatobacter sp.]MDJ0768755.1 lysylphosphatidylglycerol synthase transmembrane domain-containing protein [Ilumatobacter sp.]